MSNAIRNAAGVVLLALNLVVCVLLLLAPTLALPISAESIGAEAGLNFIADVRSAPPFPYVIEADTATDAEASRGILTEDGKTLGPAHTLHSEIRSKGAGRFSFWSGKLYFSSSDGSDPRTNGRAYRMSVETRLPHRITFGLLALDLLFLLAFPRAILRGAARHSGALLATVVGVAAGRVLLAAAGAMPPVFATSALPIDRSMAVAILGHLALGFILFGATYAAGVGSLLWLDQRRDPGELVLRAFLPGTLVLAAAALLALTMPGGVALAALIWAVVAAPSLRYRAKPAEIRRALWPALLCAPAIALYATVLSFRFHGPDALVAGSPHGDEAIYVGWANALTQHLAPILNPAVEGLTTPYGNLLPSLLMAPLLGLRWFDPYLFLSSSLPVLSLMSLAMTAPLLAWEAWSSDDRRPASIDLLVFAALGAAAYRYPSVLVESPPFAFLVPVVVTTIHLAVPRRSEAARPWQALATAAVGTAVSKVVAFPVLALAALPEVLRHLRARASRRQGLLAAALGTAILAYIAVALRTYLPVFLKVGALGPDSWDTIVRYRVTDPVAVGCVIARDAGAALLALAWARSGATGLKMGVWAGVGLWFLMPFLFYTSLTAATLLTAAACLADPRMIARGRPLFLVAAALMLPQSVRGEVGGRAVTLAWYGFVATLTAALAWAIAVGAVPSPIRPAGASRRGTLLALPAASAALLAVSLCGAATGAIAVGPDAPTFTPAMRDIWRAVRRLTPPRALVFTDQAGDDASRIGGWNDFALSAQRQFYIVSWSGAPQWDAGRRKARLDSNAAILSGAIGPDDLSLTQRYDGSYAVVDASAVAPAWFIPIYRNPSFALYRITSQASGGKAAGGKGRTPIAQAAVWQTTPSE